MNDTEIYIGIMSGTSMDGVDAVAVEFKQNRLQYLAHAAAPFDDALRAQLQEFIVSGPDELERAARMGIRLANEYAKAVKSVLQKAHLTAQDVRAIGVHGQTVRHCPQQGFSVQLNNPALLAELTGIDVIADFRSRDLAAGGQGAPLVPAFHAHQFGCDHARALVNIGGIANVSLLNPQDGSITGFDTGPGNTLLDSWIEHNRHLRFDDNGRWALTGQVNEELLQAFLSEAYFTQAPPKSTGRELFNLDWIRCALFDFRSVSAQDVQRTLLELTAQTIVQAIFKAQAQTQEIFVCGGGALNGLLMQRIEQLSGVRVRSTAALGVDPMHVECMAFAWLAWAFMHKKAGNLPAVTQARGPRILGAYYPA